MKIKAIAQAVICIILVLSFSGCGVKQTSSNDKVTLKYVMIGPGKQEDSEKVWMEFNKKLQEQLPNVEVKFEIIPVGEYKQKFMLMVASREQIDIANTYGLSFAEEVNKGTFAEMDDLLTKYGQGIKKALPEVIFDYMKVNGKVYGVPSYQMLGIPQSLKVQKEYADKYLDINNLKSALYSSEVTSDAVFETVEDYFSKLKAAGKIYDGTVLECLEKGYEHILGDYVFRIDDNKCKVEYLYQTDLYKKIFQKHSEWYKKGYIRKDIITTNDWNVFKKDGWTLWSGNYEPWIDKTESAKYGFEVLNIPKSDKNYIPMYASAAGTSILTASKHKDEAMQFINLLQTDKNLYNMLTYGIEGEHYVKVGNDSIEAKLSTSYPVANDKYGLYKWVLGNTSLAFTNQYEPEGYKKWVFDEINASKFKSNLIGFQPDSVNVLDLISQIDAIKGEYKDAILAGTLENYSERYDQWMKKIDLAGNSQVIEALQKQVDAFLNTKK